MIDYDATKWFGFHVIMQMSGSVLPASVIPMSISMLVAVLVQLEIQAQNPDGSEERLSVFSSFLKHPYPHQITAVMIGFMMVFRVQLSYSRYWEGVGRLQDMYTKWYDAAVQTCSFDEMAKGEAGENGAAFRLHAVHLFSAMSCCCLLELRKEGLDVLIKAPGRYTGPGSAVSAMPSSSAPVSSTPSAPKEETRRPWQWPILRRTCGLPAPEPDYGGRDAIEVIAGWQDDEIEHLAQHEPHFVDCALARLVRLISVRFKEGGLNMPAPIVSRIYQELSNGALGFHQAQKIAFVPFPFPYAQLLAIMKTYFVLTVPLAVSCFTDEAWFAVVMSACSCVLFVSLNEVAIELEDPFGNDANDLPLRQMHNTFNKALVHLLHQDNPASDNHKSATYMKLQSSIRATLSRSIRRASPAPAAASPSGSFSTERRKSESSPRTNGLLAAVLEQSRGEEAHAPAPAASNSGSGGSAMMAALARSRSQRSSRENAAANIAAAPASAAAPIVAPHGDSPLRT
jgi:predicted membrane chloride channel (bestrophin family)